MLKRVLSFLLAIVLTMGLAMLTPPVEAQAASTMSPSDEVANYLKETEGFSAIPYWDYSQWTVGFGTRCPDEHLERYQKEGIPVAEAHALFAGHLSGVAYQVSLYMERNGITLNQHQFDALVCLTYNKGTGWLGMENEPVTIAAIEGDVGNKFVAAISLTCYAGGSFLPALMRRRLIEADMYINGNYSRVPGENYCYVRYDGNGGEVSRTVQGYNVDLPVEFYCVATREGYTFLGWYTEPQGGSQIKELSKATDEMILYAHWEEGAIETEPFEPIQVTITTAQLNVRAKPGSQHAVVGYVYENSVQTIYAIQEEEGIPWGKTENGWIILAYTDYRVPVTPAEPGDPDTPVQPGDTTPPAEEEVKDATFPDRLPFTGTVVGTNVLNVYNGPHNTFPKVSTLSPGDRVTVLETYELLGVLWGRTESGWIRMDHCILFEGYQLLAHSFTATVNTNNLSVRSGPGTEFTRIAYIHNGTKLTITAIVEAGGYTWGMYDGGWVALEYSDYNSAKLSYYQNHSYGSWTVYQAASCSAAGQERRTCQHCSHYEVKAIEKTAHSYGSWHVSKAATCVEAGEELRECAACGHKEGRSTPVTQHSLSTWYTATAATCTKAGTQRRDCANCDYHETQVTALAEHTMGAWTIVKEATASETGLERRECVHCDHYEEKILPLTEHIYGNWYTVTAASCTSAGTERRDCSHCDHYEIRTLAATGHTMSGWQQTKAPTCAAAGTETKTCKYCSHSETREIAPTGKHSYGSWYTVTAATSTKEGQQRRDCKTCSHYETKTIACVASVVEKTYGTLTGWHYLNIRSGAGTNYAKIGTLNYGDRVEILDQKNVGGVLWGRYSGGWVCITDYLTLETVQEKVEASAPSDNTTTTVTKVYGTLTGWHYVNVRSGAGTNYTKTGTLNYGDKVEILDQKNVGGIVWGQFSGGWVCITDYLTLETVQETVEVPTTPAQPDTETPKEEDKPTETVTRTYGTLTGWHYVNVRTGAGTNYTKVGTLNYGDRVEILDQKTVGGILWGRYSGGWVCITDYLTLTTVTEIPDTAVPSVPSTNSSGKTYATVITNALNIRSGPGTNYSRLGYLAYGTRVEITQQTKVGNVLWGKCQQGWICLTEYTTLEQESAAKSRTSQTTMVVNTQVLNVRSGAGTSFSVVATLRMGATLTILDEKYAEERTWVKIAQGWVAKEYLTASN